MMKDASQQGADTVIFLDSNDSVRLLNTAIGTLAQSQFHFV
jgi:hypothetical protein